MRDVLAKQAVVFVLHDPVAFARFAFKGVTVKHGDRAANILDQSRSLKMPGRNGYALTANAEHVGDQVVSHDQFVGSKKVVIDK